MLNINYVLQSYYYVDSSSSLLKEVLHVYYTYHEIFYIVQLVHFYNFKSLIVHID